MIYKARLTRQSSMLTELVYIPTFKTCYNFNNAVLVMIGKLRGVYFLVVQTTHVCLTMFLFSLLGRSQLSWTVFSSSSGEIDWVLP